MRYLLINMFNLFNNNPVGTIPELISFTEKD